jgi:hypothetical protein
MSNFELHKKLVEDAAEAVNSILPENYGFILIATPLDNEDGSSSAPLSGVSSLELHSARLLAMQWVTESVVHDSHDNEPD